MKQIMIYSFLFISLLVNNIASDNQQVKPENVMAVYIYNFTKLLNWPNAIITDNFIIKVFGKSDITVPLRIIAQKETVNGKKIEVVEINRVSDITGCQILFISDIDEKQLESVLQMSEKENILTVGNKKGLAEQGVGINFIRAGNRIKFEINKKTLDKSNIKVNSQLLSLAEKMY